MAAIAASMMQVPNTIPMYRVPAVTKSTAVRSSSAAVIQHHQNGNPSRTKLARILGWPRALTIAPMRNAPVDIQTRTVLSDVAPAKISIGDVTDFLFDDEPRRPARRCVTIYYSVASLSIDGFFDSLRIKEIARLKVVTSVGISERKIRERGDREQRIVVAARTIAERDGWASVTIRRLADEIEYSQPVLYSHFENRDEIVAAVALVGFGEMAAMLHAAILPSATPKEMVEGVATAYLDYAFARPAMYEAMFVLPTGLRFARSDTPAQLRDAFGAMATVIAPFFHDLDTAAETFWATLHGLAELERHGRIRPAFRAQRLTLVMQMVSGQP